MGSVTEESVPRWVNLAVVIVCCIVASAVFLPFPILVLADLCHFGHGNCLPEASGALADSYGPMFGFNFILGSTLFLFAPVAYRLLAASSAQSPRNLVILTWILLLLSKGTLGFLWGPIDPGAGEAYILLPFVAGPIDILVISVVTGWAGRRILQAIAFLVSGGLAILVTYFEASSLIEFLPPLPEGSEVHPTDAGDVVFFVVMALLYLSVPVAVWMADARGWTLLEWRQHHVASRG